MTNDERRERYAAEISGTFGGYSNDPAYLGAAEAAMAVADAETSDLRSTLKHAQVALRNAENEIARLRAELDENTGIMQALRRQRDTAEATIARVNGVLDDMRDGLYPTGKSWADDLDAALEGEQP